MWSLKELVESPRVRSPIVTQLCGPEGFEEIVALGQKSLCTTAAGSQICSCLESVRDPPLGPGAGDRPCKNFSVTSFDHHATFGCSVTVIRTYASKNSGTLVPRPLGWLAYEHLSIRRIRKSFWPWSLAMQGLGVVDPAKKSSFHWFGHRAKFGSIDQSMSMYMLGLSEFWNTPTPLLRMAGHNNAPLFTKFGRDKAPPLGWGTMIQ